MLSKYKTVNSKANYLSIGGSTKLSGCFNIDPNILFELLANNHLDNYCLVEKRTPIFKYAIFCIF